MSEDFLEREVLGRVSMDRRSFVKKLVAGAAFAVPVIASFDMLTSQSGYGITSSNGSRHQAICDAKTQLRDSLKFQLDNLPVGTPDRVRNTLQRRVDNLDAYLAANCP